MVNPLLLVGIIPAVWCLNLLYKGFKTDRTLSNLPMAKGCVPIFGHALSLAASSPWQTMQRWISDHGGSMVRFQVFASRCVLISKPIQAERIFFRNLKNYKKDLEVSYKPFLPILGNGLVTSEGTAWATGRTLLSGAFRHDLVEDTLEVAKSAADRLSSRLEKYRGTGQPVEMAEEFRLMTLEVIGELVLSLPPDESARFFPRLYLPLVEEANRRIWNPFRPYMPTPTQFNFHKVVRELNEYMCALIRRRWKERQEFLAMPESERPARRKDILEKVLSSIEVSDWNEAMVDHLRDGFKTFILAGHETTASMLTWALYQTSVRSDLRDKILKEGHATFGTGRSPPSANLDTFASVPLPSRASLDNLEFTLCTLKETLRFYTPVPIVTRIAEKDDVLDGQKIPANMRMMVHLQALHRDPETWESPDEFKPERFSDKVPDYAFLPFINGPRNCLGQHLALLEARIVLALLHLRFKFTPVGDRIGEQDDFTVPVVPANGMLVTIE